MTTIIYWFSEKESSLKIIRDLAEKLEDANIVVNQSYNKINHNIN